jgi:hypothetical protein
VPTPLEVVRHHSADRWCERIEATHFLHEQFGLLAVAGPTTLSPVRVVVQRERGEGDEGSYRYYRSQYVENLDGSRPTVQQRSIDVTLIGEDP